MMRQPRDPHEVHVECGKGWAPLYQPIIDLAHLYGMTVLQVKEKFGRLRIYVSGAEARPDGTVPDLDPIIHAAEAASAHMCEGCGVTGSTVTTSGGWHKTLCPTCRASREGVTS